MVVEHESEQSKHIVLEGRIRELERLLGQKQVEVEYLHRVIQEGDTLLGFDLKKVRTQVLTWFQLHISEFGFSMETVYHISGIIRQGHSQARARLVSQKARKKSILSSVALSRVSHLRMGSRPLYKMLGIEGMGINRFERLLSEEGLGIRRERNKRKTTHGHLFQGRAVNKTNGRVLTDINQLRVE